ncbi:putative disease resistance RPP13-like protein 1 [Vigna unguiculata]|uniref:putative disease resistance RPP13-like protein 1 n=1 Tax=Vigna unguiculata TaxID=3917 RepID=UPI001016F773|nr:putative disease resistance RPP13-like protein 1 [Vigna unguiculata]
MEKCGLGILTEPETVKLNVRLDTLWNPSRGGSNSSRKCEGSVFTKRSKILVTARAEKVASNMRSKVHLLRELRGDECLNVFEKHALKDDDLELNDDLKEIGRRIVEKCKGLPLALKTIGSLLRTKSSISYWKSVLENDIWDLPKEVKIIPALLLSYQHLPSHLKRCFAYCALFPKDREFDKKELILLWMAEGFLHHSQQINNVEEIGEQYFEDLLMRLKFDKGNCIPKTTRHFSFAFDDFLRVLSLNAYSELREVPDSVGDLKHLHSLDLSRTGIQKLPDSTCLLYNLLILKLNYCSRLEELPSNLHKLTKLCFLEFKNTKVTEMPMRFGELKNLQVLSPVFVNKNNEFNIKHLGGLNLHGRLSINEVQNIVNPLDALEANLKNKDLVELELKWESDHIPDDPRKEKKVLENLQPSKIVEYLSIENYGGTKFPSWVFDNSLSNLVSLRLEDCKYCLCLPPLGLLSSLKTLKIIGLDGIVSIGDEFYGNSSSSFTSLESLEFSR